jgi:hypothetical protein
MRNTFRFGEFVHVARKNKSGIPDEFLWRGRRHRIRRLESYRDERRRTRNATRLHRIFLIHTASGHRCVISHDVDGDTWRMEHLYLTED